MFRGDLKADAPGVFRTLQRQRINSATVDEILAAYRLAWESGSLTETDEYHRAPGASFNPRPARLISIALKELSEVDRLPTAFEPLLTVLATNPRLDNPTLSPKALAIVLIDDLRHLHLKRRQSIAPDVQPAFIAALPRRLGVVLQTAVSNAKLLSDAAENSD